jgi:hypothetical protein
MGNSDIYLLLAIETGISLFTLFSFFKDIRIKILENESGVNGVITRAEKTMNALYAAYGSSMASFLVIVTNANGVDGHRVALILVPFICLTYLFYFSTWFRNAVFFPAANKIRKD